MTKGNSARCGRNEQSGSIAGSADLAEENRKVKSSRIGRSGKNIFKNEGTGKGGSWGQ